MEFDINFFSTKSSMSIYDIDEKFEYNIDKENEFSFRGGFDITDSEKDTRIAHVTGIFFDKDKILNEGESVVNIADMLSGDALEALRHLVESGEYDNIDNNDMMLLPLYVFYMETFFVYPDYINLSEYIINNLYNFFLYSFNLNLHCTIFHPQPEYPTFIGPGFSKWEHLPDSGGNQKKENINLLKKCGYSILNESDFYFINYTL